MNALTSTDGAEAAPDIERLKQRLGARPLVLVGLMGAGKSAVGRKVASDLGLRFVDSDAEIEKAADRTIPEIFADYGEPEFRRLEASVIRRLLAEGTRVLATGGGAYMNAETREAITEAGVCLWLRGDLDLLMNRVSRKPTRPLLQNPDPRGVMQRLMDERYPVYAKANIVVDSLDVPKEVMARRVVDALDAYLEKEEAGA